MSSDNSDAGTDHWRLLELDPLFEIRILGAGPQRRDPLTPNAVPARSQLRKAAMALLNDEATRAATRAAGLDGTFDAALTSVIGSPEATSALVGVPYDALPAAIARAVVAEALVRADRAAGELIPLNGDRRDALVSLLIVKLGGDTRGRFDRALLVGARLAVELGVTHAAVRRRATITNAASPLVGDVMLYLTRGAPIREHIANTISTVDDDVLVLAHSLGGIAAVDLLVSAPLANVRGIVTVGTQASYLHELGALPSLDPGANLPDTFPAPWINVFDRRDMLSFLAEPVFGDRVRDVEIDSRAPFPRSHSAYFGNAAFYSVVKDVLTIVRT